MDLIISALWAGIINLILVGFVLFREEKKKTNRIFFFLGLSLAAWNFSSLGIYVASSETTALLWVKFFYLSLVFVPSAFFHFVLTLIDDHWPSHKRLRQLGYLLSYLFLLASGFGLLSNKIEYLNGYYYPSDSIADIIFIIFFVSYGSYGIYLLARRKSQTNNPLERKHLACFFGGSYIVLLGISSNLLMLIGLKYIYPFGHLATGIYPLIVTYAILKHKLIDLELTGIDLCLRKIKFYLASGLIFFLFASLLLTIERLIQRLSGYYLLWGSIPVLIILAFSLQPLRKNLQVLIDNRFFRRKTGQQIKMLEEMLVKINGHSNKEAIFDTLLNGLVNILYLSNAAVILLDEEQEEYEISSAVGIDAIKKRTNKFSSKEGIIPYLKSHLEQEHLLNHNLQADSEISRGIKRDFEKLNAEVFIPLRSEQELMGILSLGRKMSGDGYDPKDLIFFFHLGQKVGLDIKRVSLLQKKTEEFLKIIEVLIVILEKKKSFGLSHSEMVSRYAELIAQELGLPDNEVTRAKHSGLLHNLGYLFVCEQILSKRSHLTPAEFENIKSHTIVGSRLLSFITNNQELIWGLKYHHERLDGCGYPESLEGKNIPLIARIIGVADVYIAMISDRPYRRGFYREDVLAELKRHSGYEFDPKVVQALERVLSRELMLR